MKMLTKATQSKFRPMVERISSWDRERFKNERIEFKTKIRPDGVPYTTMDLFSIRADSPDKFPARCRSTFAFPHDLFEKRFIKDSLWYVPLTDSNVELIFAIWPHSQIRLDRLSRKYCNKIIANGIRQDHNARVTHRYHLNKQVPDDNCVEMEGKELLPYQTPVRFNALRSSGFCNFSKMGTGKTPTSISIAVNDCIKQSKEFYRCLIVCPKNVRFNWETEIKAFCPVEHKITVVRGPKHTRERDLIHGLVKVNGERISFVIASYGALRSTLEAFCLEKLLGGTVPISDDLKWDLAILDESHYIKSPKAQRTKAALKLRDSAKKRMVLTGTPIANSLFDLWSQWEFCEKYLSGFSNFNAFKDFHAEYDKNNRGNRQISSYVHVPLLQERLARTAFIISKEEALPDLPEKTYDTIEVDMDKEQAKIYDKVMQQLYVEIQNELDASDNKELTINNILTKLLRLAQITSGFICWDAQYNDIGEETQPASIDRFDPNNKLEELIKILKEKEPHQKTIVWSCFIPAIKTIAARLRLEGIECVTFHGQTKDDDRKLAEHRFNCDPKCTVFVGNPAAGGVGLNLLGYDYRQETDNEDARLTNCDHVIYYAQNWNYPTREQSEDRAHRKGTRKSVRITDLVVPGSIDQEIRERVLLKKTTVQNVTDLQRTLARIANPAVEDD